MPTSLEDAVAVAGYYPALASTVLKSSIGAETVTAHFVHAETTFDAREVRRHMTVLALTPTRLIRVHIDDGPHADQHASEAQATSEAVMLKRITGMAMTHSVLHAEKFAEGDLPTELVLSVGWGVHSRVELEPADCGDENCDADHGYSGAITSDDPLVRVSKLADGEESVRALQMFATTLQESLAEHA